MNETLTLLLVSPSPERREKVEKTINRAQVFTVISTTSSTEAIKVLKTQCVHFIVSEIDIGSVDGWRLSRMVRSSIYLTKPDVPFVLITSTYCERIAETTARVFGIDAVVPFEKLQLLSSALSNAFSSDINRNEKLPILVIEDTEDTADLVKRIVRRNFECDIAYNGKDGISLFREKTYSIILLDVMLPGMSGHEVLEVILSERPQQTVVVMTAHGNMDMAEELMMTGAADYIQKPFHAEQLRKVCEIASQRQDFMVANQQFADKVKALEASEDSYRSLSQAHSKLLNHLSTVILELDKQGDIHFLNQAWQALTGYSVADSLTQPFKRFVCPNHEEREGVFVDTLDDMYKGRIESCTLEFKLLNKNAKDIWVEGRFDITRGQEEIVGITATIDNITGRKEAEMRLQHLALHDTLTGLHNRYFFDGELNRIASLSNRNNSVHCLLYIDLDHFKVINDTQGHQQGDMVLKEVANTLSRRLRDSDLLCRIGGDEFAVLLFDTDADTASNIAHEVCERISQGHYQFDDRIYKISCSIGISQIDGSSKDAHEYLKQADIALYVAKKRGRNLVHVYSHEDKESDDFKNSIEWAHKLQEAIINDNIVMHFQPIIKIQTKEVAYFEALVRLNIDGSMIFPGQFIPALERAEDIHLLDHQVVSKTIWMLSQYPCLKKVAINLSAQAFSDERLLPIIENKLERYNVSPSRVIFELTESASLTNLAATQRMIQRLTEMGCEFSVDDFGTGFSTFAYLKELPANSVKIDGSFVKDMLNDPIDLALVKAIKDVAHSLDKYSVAEFVENEAILLKLQEIGVDYAQGYHISKPLPIEQIVEKYSF